MDALFGSQWTVQTFLVVTFVVIVAIIVFTDDLGKALMIITLITNFLIIASQSMLLSERRDEKRDRELQQSVVAGDATGLDAAASAGADTFASRPMAYYPYADAAPAGSGAGGGGGGDLPLQMTPAGAGLSPADIDALPWSREAVPGAGGPVYNPVNGPATGAGAVAPAPYNPYQRNNLETRAMPGFCARGLPAETLDTHDGDRKVVDQAKWRNDPSRAAAGAMGGSYDLMKKYVAEELDEQENRTWWGIPEL